MLITHGESGRSGVGRTRNVVAPTSLAGQFEQPYGPMGPPTLFTIPVLRYMKVKSAIWLTSGVSDTLAGAEQVDRPPVRCQGQALREVAGALGGDQDQRAAAIGHQAALQ